MEYRDYFYPTIEDISRDFTQRHPGIEAYKGNVAYLAHHIDCHLRDTPTQVPLYHSTDPEYTKWWELRDFLESTIIAGYSFFVTNISYGGTEDQNYIILAVAIAEDYRKTNPKGIAPHAGTLVITYLYSDEGQAEEVFFFMYTEGDEYKPIWKTDIPVCRYEAKGDLNNLVRTPLHVLLSNVRGIVDSRLTLSEEKLPK